MLNEALQVAHQKYLLIQEQEKTASLLAQLPVQVLKEIAETGSVKLASMFVNDCSNGPNSWVEQFKGTPFFEQAIALEQEELQLQTARQQSNRVESQKRDAMYDQEDQLRLKKKLLELQKARNESQVMSGGGGPPNVTGSPDAQGAGALGPVAPEGQQEGMGDANKLGHAKTKIAQADAWGRELARADAEKIARAELVQVTGDMAGRLLAKTAAMPGALGSIAQWAIKNPHQAGAAIGGTLGAAHGFFRGGGGVGSAVSEGALGAGLGHAAGGIGGGIHAGQSPMDAAKAYGTKMKAEAGKISDKFRAAHNEVKPESALGASQVQRAE